MQREDAVKGGKFLLILVISYVLLSVLIGLIPLQWIEFFVAKSVLLVLGFFGFKGEIVLQEPALILFEGFSVQISYLCTGLMEFIILASALIATPEIKKEKKLLGVIWAGIATFLFNLIRISVTVGLIQKTSLETIELAHDVLFRVSLFVLIAGYYFVWYYFALKK